MGDRNIDRTPMAWQGTLAQMKAHGTRLAQTAPCKCSPWIDLDVDQLIAKWGPEWMAWDRRPPCKNCGAPGHYMASPGHSTPFRPLRTSIVEAEKHKRFVQAFGFTKRDVIRIKALAEATTANYTPAALNDLDVGFRVGAVWPGTEARSSGKVLGEWAGRTLLYWEMRDRELDLWKSRKPGPRKLT